MNRTHRINFWLSDKDLAILDQRAKAEGISHSDLIRKLILDAEIIPIPNVDYAGYAKEFKRLGNILNDIVKEYYVSGVLDTAVDAVLHDIRSLAVQLRDELVEKTVDLEVKHHGDQK